ncbi:MAG: AAA domain-containing protein [Ignavibacteriae bacterium]|nr:AAA domain-containing protein [Ignavibacteriota bacterium]
MPTESTTSPQLFQTLAAALNGELAQLSKFRQRATLMSGEYLRSYAGFYYYRFEISEDLFLYGIDRVKLVVGQFEPMELPSKVICLENQFLTLAVPVDMGPVIPEVTCTWNYEESLKPVIDRLATLGKTTPLSELLFAPWDVANSAKASIELQTLPTTPAEQQSALQRIMQNRVSLLWGPVRTGKTHLLALLAANYVKAGKKVLFVAPTSGRVDDTVMKAIALGNEIGIDMLEKTTRVGLPLFIESDLTTKLSFEHQVDEEKKKLFKERFQLLEEYWRVRVKQTLHEDYYLKLNDLRTRAEQSKLQFDRTTQELSSAREAVKKLESASMFEKMKSGYKDSLVAAQKLVSDKLAAQKRLQTLSGTLANEVLKLEAQAPVRGEEPKTFQATAKRIEDLGGLDILRKAVEESGLVNETKLLDAKQFIGTTLSTALADARLRETPFDLVMVDDAEVINLPSLAALAAHAKEKLVIAGDPFQVDPESATNTEASQLWLQRDIFMYAAQTEDLPKLFEASQRNDHWLIFFSAQYATTPKLAQFVASTLFENKVQATASANAKGRIYFFDTSSLKGECQQYAGRKRVLPFNNLQAQKAVECVKHALMESGRSAIDIGVITPFNGQTLSIKQLLRLEGIKNVEVGTPQTFRGRRKKAIIFDTTMAGVDYTVRHLDDRKVGEQKVASLLNTVFSCTNEDLYVLADMGHFQSVYKERYFPKLLVQLQSQSDGMAPLPKSVRHFDDLEWDKRAPLFDIKSKIGKVEEPVAMKEQHDPAKTDPELAYKMKMLERRQQADPGAQSVEQETFLAVLRVLGRLHDNNLLSQFIGGEPLFHHSLTTEQATEHLLIDFCQNEKDFREIMERWNLLIYEKSGGHKNTTAFYTKPAPETRVRQDIYNFKSYYSQDVEAALEEGKQKLAVAVSRVFQETLGKPNPSSPAEWSKGYVGILGKLDSYLAWISSQLRK